MAITDQISFKKKLKEKRQDQLADKMSFELVFTIFLSQNIQHATKSKCNVNLYTARKFKTFAMRK